MSCGGGDAAFAAGPPARDMPAAAAPPTALIEPRCTQKRSPTMPMGTPPASSGGFSAMSRLRGTGTAGGGWVASSLAASTGTAEPASAEGDMTAATHAPSPSADTHVAPTRQAHANHQCSHRRCSGSDSCPPPPPSPLRTVGPSPCTLPLPMVPSGRWARAVHHRHTCQVVRSLASRPHRAAPQVHTLAPTSPFQACTHPVGHTSHRWRRASSLAMRHHHHRQLPQPPAAPGPVAPSRPVQSLGRPTRRRCQHRPSRRRPHLWRRPQQARCRRHTLALQLVHLALPARPHQLAHTRRSPPRPVAR